MTGLVDWIGDLVRWLATLVPRLVVVHRHEHAVAFTLARPPAVLPCGWRLVWPLRTTVHRVDAREIVVNLPDQVLAGGDGVTWLLSPTVRYRVTGPARWFAAAENGRDAVEELVARAIADAASGMPRIDPAALLTSARAAVVAGLRRYGARLVEPGGLGWTHAAPTRVLYLPGLGQTAQVIP